MDLLRLVNLNLSGSVYWGQLSALKLVTLCSFIFGITRPRGHLGCTLTDSVTTRIMKALTIYRLRVPEPRSLPEETSRTVGMLMKKAALARQIRVHLSGGITLTLASIRKQISGCSDQSLLLSEGKQERMAARWMLIVSLSLHSLFSIRRKVRSRGRCTASTAIYSVTFADWR